MRDDVTIWVLLGLIFFQFLLGWFNGRRYERIARRDRINLKWFRDAETIVHRERRRWTRRFIRGSWPGDCDHGRPRMLCIICKPEGLYPHLSMRVGSTCPHGGGHHDRCPVCSPLTWDGRAVHES